jgi:glutathione S-transferase
MKLYDFPLAPNPRRVRIFAAEKGIRIPLEQVDIFAAKNRTPEFLKKNPSGGLPVLELDDGTCLAESIAICRYLEGLHPEPNLMGRDFREQAFIEMWNRRMEMELFGVVGRAFQNTAELFKGRIPQFADYGAAQRAQAGQRLVRLDGELANREFIAADRYTIADVTALVAIDLGANMAGIAIPGNLSNLKRWHASVSARPSAKA